MKTKQRVPRRDWSITHQVLAGGDRATGKARFVGGIYLRCAYLTLLVAAPALPVQATDIEAAKAKFAEGGAFFSNEQYAEALAAYETSFELNPKTALLFNIGMCQQALFRYAEALLTFNRLIKEGEGQVKQELLEKARASMDKLQPLVGRLKLSNAPAGALLEINRVRIGTVPLTRPVYLNPGQYTVRVTLDGYKTLQTQVHVAAGGEISVQAELIEVEAPREEGPPALPIAKKETPPPVTTTSKEPVRHKKLQTAGWTISGLGAAILVASAVTGGVSYSLNESLKEACTDLVCKDDKRDEIRQKENLGLTTDVLLGVGGAALATGVVLLIVRYNKIRDDRAEKAAVVPFTGSGSAGALIQWNF